MKVEPDSSADWRAVAADMLASWLSPDLPGSNGPRWQAVIVVALADVARGRRHPWLPAPPASVVQSVPHVAKHDANGSQDELTGSSGAHVILASCCHGSFRQ